MVISPDLVITGPVKMLGTLPYYQFQSPSPEPITKDRQNFAGPRQLPKVPNG